MNAVLDLLADSASAAIPRCGATAVVALDGRAGSGKSTWGTLLAERLACPIVRMEDLYPGWDGLDDGIAALDLSVLRPIAEGGQAAVPQHDWVNGGWRSPVTITPGPLLVVEGVGSGARRVADRVSLLVWLDCPDDQRRERALGRPGDGAAFASEWDGWAEQERSLLAHDPAGERADIVLDTSAPSVAAATVRTRAARHG